MKERWQEILQKNNVTNLDLQAATGLAKEELDQIAAKFPIQVNRNMITAELNSDNPVWKQFLPDLAELDERGQQDPLNEEKYRVSPLIIHRYRNRVLFLASTICASYCRFCTRRRLVGGQPDPTLAQLRSGFDYLSKHEEISEVILSGGDPLLLKDKKLTFLLNEIKKISNIELIRLSTRTLLTLPQRISNGLVRLLKQAQPIYIITQFNHPLEFSAKSDRAISLLVDNGIQILNQSVLLKGVNDDMETMHRLAQKLVQRRVRPYYLHQLDPVKGAWHFQVPVEKGKAIIAALREQIGGFAVPTYVYDDPKSLAKEILFP
jgi:lysine 2,3-aminomutase